MGGDGRWYAAGEVIGAGSGTGSGGGTCAVKGGHVTPRTGGIGNRATAEVKGLGRKEGVNSTDSDTARYARQTDRPTAGN